MVPELFESALRLVWQDPYDSSFPVLLVWLSERRTVVAYVVAMIIILGLAAVIVGMVVLGIEGRGKEHAPKLADRMARAARHLNGDGEPPKQITRQVHRLLAERH